jgi:hypothetical protein
MATEKITVFSATAEGGETIGLFFDTLIKHGIRHHLSEPVQVSIGHDEFNIVLCVKKGGLQGLKDARSATGFRRLRNLKFTEKEMPVLDYPA